MKILKFYNLLVTLSLMFLLSCGGGSEIAVTPSAGIEIGAAQGADDYQYLVELTGAQVIPASETRHTARGEFSVDDQTNQLFGTVVTSFSTATSVHLHEGGSGEVGSVVVSLLKSSDAAGNNVFEVPAGFFLTSSLLGLYRSGKFYVDVHAGDSELRGQLSNEQPVVSIQPVLTDLQTKLFTPVCSGCHTGTGNSLPASINFSSVEGTYASLVGVFSIGEPALLRVDPGDADNSLLVRKVEGTQVVGGRMPFRGSKLDAETIAALRQWINIGAGR